MSLTNQWYNGFRKLAGLEVQVGTTGEQLYRVIYDYPRQPRNALGRIVHKQETIPGSVRLVVSLDDATFGEVVQRMDYDEYGVVLTDTAPGFQPFGFAGGMYDKNTSYLILGQRYYFPVIGKWTRKEAVYCSP